MIVHSSHFFDKNFKKRVSSNKKLVIQFQERLQIFINQSNHRLLKTHELTGPKKGLSAFSITGDIRVVFRKISETEVVLVDIGSHNQVY